MADCGADVINTNDTILLFNYKIVSFQAIFFMQNNMDYEIGMLRDLAMLDNPNADFNTNYTFFYDETNNFRKLKVREFDFNNSLDANFVLGGVAYSGQRPQIDNIFDFLKLTPNQTEVKFKTITNGDFLTCLTSKKLEHILRRVLDSDLYMHYFSLNYLYWSLVDIVDSTIINSGFNQEQMLYLVPAMKDAFYITCKLEIDFVHDLFYRYNYPNLQKNDIKPFCKAIINLIEKYEDESNLQFPLMMLKGLLQGALKNNDLIFLRDNTSHMLIDSFVHYYLTSIYLFKNSQHIFDIEVTIQEQLADFAILDNNTPITNYQFVVSESEILIQLSDVMVGLFGKMTEYTNTHESDEIIEEYSKLTQKQRNNIKLLMAIIDKSDKHNTGFLHNINGYSELSKVQLLQNLVNDRC